MLGNMWEWVQDVAASYEPGKPDAMSPNLITGSYNDEILRVLRGGSFYAQTSFVRSAHRRRRDPTSRRFEFGFRPSRTYP